MALSTSVPPLTISDAGPVIPADSDILAGAQADQDTAFGGGLNLTSLETPQGQMASSLTAIISDTNAAIAAFVNQLDPRYSSGTIQDAIGMIYFLTRKPATSTTVTCTIGGIPGRTIAAGQAVATDSSGYRYSNTGSITIGSNGTATATFANQETGPIPCAANTLTQIYQAVEGWESINNPSAGSLGRDVESRTDFESRRRNSVAANGVGSAEAVYGSIAALSGVSDLYVYDNKTGASVNFGSTSFPVAAHSICASVLGGTDADIASAIWRKDGSGGTVGNTTVTVIDVETGYNPPYPTYEVKFLRPSNTGVYFAVTVADNPLLPADIVEQIQNAIIARFTGADGGSRARIASAIYASNYFAPVASLSEYLSVLSITVGLAPDPTGASITMGLDQAPVISEANISVTVS